MTRGPFFMPSGESGELAFVKTLIIYIIFMGAEASASQRCRGGSRMKRDPSTAHYVCAQGERNEVTRWGRSGARLMCDRGVAKI